MVYIPVKLLLFLYAHPKPEGGSRYIFSKLLASSAAHGVRRRDKPGEVVNTEKAALECLEILSSLLMFGVGGGRPVLFANHFPTPPAPGTLGLILIFSGLDVKKNPYV
jgi:hypothetical protein